MNQPAATGVGTMESAGAPRPDARRSIISEAAIALAICGGAALLIAEPLERRLQEAHATLSDLKARSVQAARRVEEPKALAALEAAKARTREVAEASSLAVDEGALMTRVSDLARERGLRLDEMQPGGGTDARTMTGKAGQPGDRRTGYTYRLVGTFEAVAGLLHDLDRTGFTVVRKVRLSPMNEPGSRELSVLIETEHFAFATGPLGGQPGAQGPIAGVETSR